jgi:hypothetical protein
LALLARAARLDAGGSCDCGDGIADAYRFHVAKVLMVLRLFL